MVRALGYPVDSCENGLQAVAKFVTMQTTKASLTSIEEQAFLSANGRLDESLFLSQVQPLSPAAFPFDVVLMVMNQCSFVCLDV